MNRLTAEGDVAGPEHKVSLDIALKAITIDAAYSIQQEEDVGSIEVGKQANLTILENTPCDVPPAALKGIAVWGTMLEGRLQPAPATPQAAAGEAMAASQDDAEVTRAAMQQPARLMDHDHDH